MKGEYGKAKRGLEPQAKSRGFHNPGSYKGGEEKPYPNLKP
jgi:hypothetical protein